MTRSVLNLFLVGSVALAASGCDIQAQSLSGVDGKFDRTLHVDGPVDLDISSRSGHIRITTGPVDAVQITANIRAYGSMNWMHAYTASEQVRLLEATPPIEQSGNRVTVGYISDAALASNVTINYDVTVPANTRLRTTSRSGDQTIDAILGPVTASSRSGSVRIQGVRGDLDVDTRSGDVDLLSQQNNNVKVYSRSGRVRLEGQPARVWTVETRSGDVDVALSHDGGAEVDFDSRSGSVDSNRPVEVRSTKTRHRMQGVIGRGGGRLEVTTRSGSMVGSSRVDLQACKLEYSIVSPK